MVDKKKFFLFDGQIIASKDKNNKNEIISFEQLNIDLTDLTTSTIKQPKIQETRTLELLKCFSKSNFQYEICKKEETKKEIIPALNRRLILPLYIPVISLICSLLLLNSKKNYLNKISIFFYSFILLIFTEMSVRYVNK